MDASAGLVLPTIAAPGGRSRRSARRQPHIHSRNGKGPIGEGLLLARRRVGLRVRDRDDWNLLDPQVLSWHPDVARDEALITGLIEVRRIIEPSAAALGAAQRATAADLAESSRPIWEWSSSTNLEACCEADLKFHVSVVAASHNVVLKGRTGTIEAALRATFAITNRQLATAQSRALSAHKAVFESGCATPPAPA